MNELAQLCLEDVYQAESGTWVVSFNDNAPDKRLKNAASRRLLPVHPRLIELGLDRWAKALRGAGHTRLFPELPYDQGKGYSKAAVKQFSAYMARLGYKRDGKLTFHSFRHTFVNRLPMPLRNAFGDNYSVTSEGRTSTTRSTRRTPRLTKLYPSWPI